jgi:hypothetical protein
MTGHLSSRHPVVVGAGDVAVVIYRALFYFLLHNHIINIKEKFFFR